MIRNIYFDKLLFIIFLILIIIGIVFVYSALSTYQLYSSNSSIIIKKEILITSLGFLIIILTYLLPISFWKKIAYPLTVLTILLLILVLLIPTSGVKRWINLGFMNFQPSELAKLTTILFLATFIDRKKNEGLNNWSKLLTAFLVPFLISFLILIEPHKGAAGFIILIALLIIGSSYFSLKKILAISSIPIIILVFYIKNSEYAMKRINAFLNPMGGSENSHQVFQSLLAFAKGGIIGDGIGAGTQKLLYLPEIHTDFIFALIGEETGFIGCLFVISLFILLLFRGIYISLNRRDTFTQVLGVGITYMIVVQAAIHILVNVGLFPPTGFTLPFVSYGGSSFLIECISAGILLKISKEPIKSIFYGE
ncbi:FtsW/RodA/SpoVE family cell cycle protein [Hydrogenothermus marinus]|uniref:Probable peptidoglycan glycosyltransferase FtsW n=1 Tax=Hydrogenothermus marinus TaxID=133270 RepID=A0A3M0B804_9AQUI|nr:FtsW/RodA/SpoVE family cell cycle protein [Hydrogenothermus marinus]RMA93257.1 cell division protein FtsW [Hydrogenothermus marinus]